LYDEIYGFGYRPNIQQLIGHGFILKFLLLLSKAQPWNALITPIPSPQKALLIYSKI
jgi:hypothetical protein